MTSVTFVVSAHGFGHSARSAAVIDALARRLPDLRPTIVTTAPEWFFHDSLSLPFSFIELATDVGLVQRTSFDEDIPATIERLRAMVPPAKEQVGQLVRHLETSSSQLVVADISVLGLVAANQAALPSLLLENFTWDWIYDAYREQWPELGRLADSLTPLFSLASQRVHARPACQRVPGAISVDPISRSPRQTRDEVRRELGVEEDCRLVLLTMGGIEYDFGALEHLTDRHNTVYVVPGGSETIQRQGSLIALPHHSPFYHPDLVGAADVVVAKIGYSTLAECYHADAAFLHIPRERFPESPILAAFADTHLRAAALPRQDFTNSTWLDRVDELCEAPKRDITPRPNGADQVAEIIVEMLKK